MERCSWNAEGLPDLPRDPAQTTCSYSCTCLQLLHHPCTQYLPPRGAVRVSSQDRSGVLPRSSYGTEPWYGNPTCLRHVLSKTSRRQTRPGARGTVRPTLMPTLAAQCMANKTVETHQQQPQGRSRACTPLNALSLARPSHTRTTRSIGQHSPFRIESLTQPHPQLRSPPHMRHFSRKVHDA